MLQPIADDDKDELVENYQQLHGDLKELSGAKVDVHHVDNAFGDYYELRLHTLNATLNSDEMKVMAIHGVGVEYLGESTWQLMEED